MKLFFVQPPKPSLAVGGKDLAIFEPLVLEYPAATVPKNITKSSPGRGKENFSCHHDH
jgi:hypothetical protein